MSDQRWRSSCTFSDGKYINNAKNKKARSKNYTKCEYTPGREMSGRPRYDEATPRLDGFLLFLILS